jgi:hypothetical protein
MTEQTTNGKVKIPCRLFGIVAREAPVVAIFRRGPSRWCQLVRWDTSTDKIERGQWFRGRVYERRCDLSPDGTLLIYFGMNGKFDSETKGSWTAVSKLPYWTALLMWPKGDTWNGGGLFVDRETVFVNGGDDTTRGVGRLRIVREHPLVLPVQSECPGIYFPRMKRDGWEMGKVEAIDKDTTRIRWTKQRDGVTLVRYTWGTTVKGPDGRGSYFDEYEWVGKDGSPRKMERVEWADWDLRGKLIFGRDGELYRGTVTKGMLEEKRVADLNPGAPEKANSPKSARTW